MYKLKEKPEDFIVEEIIDIESSDKGQYGLWWMKKTNYNTVDAIGKIAKALHIKDRMIGFAGTKDRNAITKQLISIKFIRKDKVERIELKDIELEYYGRSEEPLSLGDHEGNKFEIVVRNLDSVPKLDPGKLKNYFGEQRFSKNNAEIGKSIIKKDYKRAVDLIMSSDERYGMKELLEKDATNYVGALRKIPLKILKIFVHAYQSLLWNNMAEKIDDAKELPIIGFGTEVDDSVKEVLDSEGVSSRDFIIREIPELSSEGTTRNLYMKPRDFGVVEKGEDELNKGKKKIKISFELGKGSYATEVVKQLF